MEDMYYFLRSIKAGLKSSKLSLTHRMTSLVGRLILEIGDWNMGRFMVGIKFSRGSVTIPNGRNASERFS